MKKIIIIVAVFMMLASFVAGCTPSEYTKGVEIDEGYPDNVLEIYDDAVVFDSEARFNKVILSLGTKDDIDDIAEYYRDFCEYKKTTPIEEENKDEYRAVFTADGYEFEVEVTEAEGKYIGDLFEYVIKITSKKLDENESVESGTDKSVSSEEPTAEPTQSPVSETAEVPARKTLLEGETPLTAAATGSWYSTKVSDSAGSPKYIDCTIYFADDKTGSFHYFDYAAQEKRDDDFRYAVSDGVLAITLQNSEQLIYDAYYDNSQLHLLNQATDEVMYMKNWAKESGKTPNLNEFTAYGCWVTYLDGHTKPVILSMWENGSGYLYNWNNDESSDRIQWNEKEASMSFKVGTLYGENLNLHHRGNVLKATREDGQTMYFYRATSNVLSAIYEISQTNDGEVGSWEATLNLDGTATHKISSGRITFNYDNSDWYVNPLDGMLYAFIFGEYASFYYYYDESELILHEPTDGLDYTFTKTQ